MNKRKLLLPLMALILTSCAVNLGPTSNPSSSSKEEIESSEELSETQSSEKQTSEKPSSATQSSSKPSSEKPSSNVPVSSPIEDIEKPFVSKAKNVTNYLYDGDVPRINITATNSNYLWDKENYTPSTLNITKQDTNDVILADSPMGIRLRGNSTAEGAKKPFRIKFDSKTSLFGLPKAKSWVLLANYFDKSNIRNYLAYLTANKLEYLGKDFQPSSIFVDLYINNEYQGLYLLCEQMQTGSGRVDIEKDIAADGTNSYMLELEFGERLEGTRDIDYFSVYSTNYQIKWPENNTTETTAYIKDFVQKAYDANKGQTNWKDYIEYKSFIDGYLLEEFFKNVDVASGSCYYIVRPGQPMYFGPVWDFDIGLDAVGVNANSRDYQSYQNAELWATGNKWFQHLLEIPELQTYTKARYKEIRPIFEETLTEIETLKPLLKNAQDRNQTKWSIPGNTSAWISSRYNSNYLKLTTYEQHYEYVVNKLKGRLQVLDKYYGS